VFKRCAQGVCQHCSEKHLHRYVAEFGFRYNKRVRLGIEDAERTGRALKGIVGKRLTYRWPRTPRTAIRSEIKECQSLETGPARV
jgi:hypothetical protein